MMSTSESREDVLLRIQKIFRDIFDDDTLKLTEDASAEDIPAWDSLMHITLCIAIENDFKTRLNPSEIAKLSNVGKIIDFLSEINQSSRV